MNLDNFRQMVNSFVNSEYFGLVSFVLAITALATAYIFYKKGKRNISLSHAVMSYNVIQSSENYDKLKIYYNDSELGEFSVSQIVIKNTGNLSIKKDDISPTNPLKISANSCDLLDSEVFFQKNPSNNAKVLIHNGNEAVVDFDYMNPGEFLIIKVLHTGIGEDNITINGEVIGANKPFSSSTIETSASSLAMSYPMAYLTILLNPTYVKLVFGFLGIILPFFLFWYVFTKESHLYLEVVLFLFGVWFLCSGVTSITSLVTKLDKEQYTEILAERIQAELRARKK